MSMICARCNEPMEDADHRGVRTSVCHKCSGIWIGGDSVQKIFLREQNAPATARALTTLFDLEFNHGLRYCPACRSKLMKTIQIENTELDFCVSCKGLYFDEGELERVYPDPSRLAADAAIKNDGSEEKSVWQTLKRFFAS